MSENKEEHQPRIMISPLAKFMCKQMRPNSKENENLAKEEVDNFIKKSKVVIFSKTYCPRCVEVKELLEKHTNKENISVMELDMLDEKKMIAIQDYLWEITQCRTVPRVFIDQKNIGGCDDCRDLEQNDKLKDFF